MGLPLSKEDPESPNSTNGNNGNNGHNSNSNNNNNSNNNTNNPKGKKNKGIKNKILNGKKQRSKTNADDVRDANNNQGNNNNNNNNNNIQNMSNNNLKAVPKYSIDELDETEKTIVLAIEKGEEAPYKPIPDILIPPLNLQFDSLEVLSPCEHSEMKVVLQGPHENESAVRYDGNGINYASANCISTYPYIKEHKSRQGDPICDQYIVELFAHKSIVVVADGCNWGIKPKTAALNAAKAFTSYLREHVHLATTTHHAARLITRAFASAQHRIIEGAQQPDDVGTTTLLGGLVLELDVSERSNPDENWGFVFGSVGDCKAYIINGKTGAVKDITFCSRMLSTNHRDCGGRLGPYLDDGGPDLRNFVLRCELCSEGDMLIVVSDGVHDNLSPRHLGKQPKDVGHEEESASWDDLEALQKAHITSKFSTQLLTDLLNLDNLVKNTQERKQDESGEGKEEEEEEEEEEEDEYSFVDEAGENDVSKAKEKTSVANTKRETKEEDEYSPHVIASKLIKHCIKTNEAAANFMIENPNKRLPRDYSTYPGKMDHTTCVVVKVGPICMKSGEITVCQVEHTE